MDIAASRVHWIWNASFAGGSLVAAFMQGLTVGALVGCLPISDAHFAGGDGTYRVIPYLDGRLLAFLIVVFVYAVAQDLPVISRWLQQPCLFVFPLAGALAAIALAISVRVRRDAVPFPLVALIFAAAFGTLAISFWPYINPFTVTIARASAPRVSLAFMFWGAGLFVFP
jgi:cytochrome bd ubiquinol oxidase subunit II